MKTLINILLYSVALVFFALAIREGYKIYRTNKWKKDFVNKYLKPQAHPVFKTIKGFGSGWGFIHALPTPGLETSEMQFTFDEDPNDIHEKNFKLIQANWPKIWPLVFESIKEKAHDYGYLESLSSSPSKALIKIPDQLMTDDTEWHVEFETPESGIYMIDIQGWSSIAYSAVTF